MKPLDTNLISGHGNAIDLLRAEYNSIWKLCALYHAGIEQDSLTDRIKVAQELCHTITICNLIEQEVLYPETRKVNEELVLDLLLAHDEINACITEIRALTPEDMDYDLEVLRLIGIVQTHIRESQRMLFPLIEREIPANRLQPLAADFMRRSLLLRALGKDDLRPRAQDRPEVVPLAAPGEVGVRGHGAAA